MSPSAQPPLTFSVDAGAVHLVRGYLRGHAGEGFIAPYIGGMCGLDPLPTLAALCHLVQEGEVVVEGGHHTWTWQFSMKRRAR